MNSFEYKDYLKYGKLFLSQSFDFQRKLAHGILRQAFTIKLVLLLE